MNVGLTQKLSDITRHLKNYPFVLKILVANFVVAPLLMIAAGMLVVQLLPDFAKKAQPWVGWLGNIAMYVLVGATLIGYFPNMNAIVGTGAILVGLAFV